MKIPILYQDDDLLVVSKPAGLVVNEARSVKEETLQTWLQDKFWKNREADSAGTGDFYLRKGIVHRLDKDTSGMLLCALKEKIFISLQEQFQKRTVLKKYFSLAHGKIVPSEGTVNVPLGRLPWNRERFGVLADGKESATTYKVIGNYQFLKEQYSYLEVTPLTGRTHQIRVHLKYLGHPVVSDKFYAGRKIYKKDLKFCPRLFLHAGHLEFMHPGSGKSVILDCPLPADLQTVLDSLTKIS